MKILITGHRGFIGTNLVEKLRHKHEIVGYDLVDGHDIRDKFALDKMFSEHQFDMVIHMAARAGVLKSIEYSDEYISTNIAGTNNIVEACKKHGVKNLIFFSSSSVLGGNENRESGLAEGADYNPISIYGITKMAGEFIVKQSKLNWFIVRPFSVYGENGRRDMVIYRWIEQIKQKKKITVYGDGNSARGYTYVGDLVAGIDSLIDKSGEYLGVKMKDVVRIFHLGGAEVITLDELVSLFDAECKKKKIEYRIDMIKRNAEDISFSFANILKSGYVLNFSPHKNFAKIVTRILKKEL